VCFSLMFCFCLLAACCLLSFSLCALRTRKQFLSVLIGQKMESGIPLMVFFMTCDVDLTLTRCVCVVVGLENSSFSTAIIWYLELVEVL
jgi:hypothetical protein